MLKKYNFETPSEYSRWHHLAAYDDNGDLIEISDWIDPVHIHGMPLEDVYINPMRELIKNGQKLPYSYVQLGPTNSCNLSCEGCYSANCRNKDTLEFDQISDVIKKVSSQVKSKNSKTAMIAFHGPGEPLCSQKNRETVLKAIQLCDELGLASRITTNATFDDDNFLEKLIGISSLKLIWVSMKAGTEEKYKKYTGTDKFKQSRKNMELIAKLRKKFDRKDLTLKASTEISKYSIGETYDAAAFSKSIGFDIFKPALHSKDFQKAYLENTQEVTNLRQLLKEMHDDTFNTLFWEIPKRCSKNYYADKFPSDPCFQVETRLYFDGSGKASPCINWLDNPSDEYDFGNIGSFALSNCDKMHDFNITKKAMKLKRCERCSDPWVSYFHAWIKKVLEININASFEKIFDYEINDKFKNLADKNVLNEYDPRENYYD